MGPPHKGAAPVAAGSTRPDDVSDLPRPRTLVAEQADASHLCTRGGAPSGERMIRKTLAPSLPLDSDEAIQVERASRPPRARAAGLIEGASQGWVAHTRSTRADPSRNELTEESQRGSGDRRQQGSAPPPNGRPYGLVRRREAPRPDSRLDYSSNPVRSTRPLWRRLRIATRTREHEAGQCGPWLTSGGGDRLSSGQILVAHWSSEQ